MFLRTRKVRFTINEEDHKEVERGDVLANRFFVQGTEITGKHIAGEDLYTYTLSKAQFPYKKLCELQQDFPSLRFKAVSDRF